MMFLTILLMLAVVLSFSVQTGGADIEEVESEKVLSARAKGLYTDAMSGRERQKKQGGKQEGKESTKGHGQRKNGGRELYTEALTPRSEQRLAAERQRRTRQQQLQQQSQQSAISYGISGAMPIPVRGSAAVARQEASTNGSTMTKSEVERKLKAVFRKWDPRRIERIPAIMAKFEGREAQLLQRVQDKYGG
jgi:hypothetical protein